MTTPTDVDYTPHLGAINAFATLPKEELARLARNIPVRDFPADTEIVSAGDYGSSMFVIVEGAVCSTTPRTSRQQERSLLWRSGEFFGEDALLGRGERSVTVTTTAPTRVLEVEKHRIDVVFRRHPEVRARLESTHRERVLESILSRHLHLAELPEQDRRALARRGELRLHAKGAHVARLGDEVTEVLLVRDGLLKASRRGGESILAYFNGGDVIGLNDPTAREYDLHAIGFCEVVVFQREHFMGVVLKHPSVVDRLGKDAMSRVPDLAGTHVRAIRDLFAAGVEVESLLVIDLDRCVRCGNCVRACHARHGHARLDRRGPIFRRRARIDTQRHQHVMLPASCRHCRDPECMVGCPTGAIQRFPHGEVDINDNCIGCQNCARKCPYGNIAMMPLAEKDRPKDNPEVVMRAIKCNLCRGYEYSNCVHECPRGAILRVDPLSYFDELAKVMGREQKTAIKWSRDRARESRVLGSKQRVRPRATWFIPVSLLAGLALATAIMWAALNEPRPRGSSSLGLALGIGAAALIGLAGCQAVRKRLRNAAIGGLEIWTQLHMVIGLLIPVVAFAHAGFKVTGLFPAVLLGVCVFEVAIGVAGEFLYAFVPRALTRLERHGRAKLFDDLLEERDTLVRGIAEATADLPAALSARIAAAGGGLRSRLRPSYDAPSVRDAARALLHDALEKEPPERRATGLKLLDDHIRIVDVRLQLSLHRVMKRWVPLHVAVACTLSALLAFHIFTALLLL